MTSYASWRDAMELAWQERAALAAQEERCARADELARQALPFLGDDVFIVIATFLDVRSLAALHSTARRFWRKSVRDPDHKKGEGAAAAMWSVPEEGARRQLRAHSDVVRAWVPRPRTAAAADIEISGCPTESCNGEWASQPPHQGWPRWRNVRTGCHLYRWRQSKWVLNKTFEPRANLALAWIELPDTNARSTYRLGTERPYERPIPRGTRRWRCLVNKAWVDCDLTWSGQRWSPTSFMWPLRKIENLLNLRFTTSTCPSLELSEGGTTATHAGARVDVSTRSAETAVMSAVCDDAIMSTGVHFAEFALEKISQWGGTIGVTGLSYDPREHGRSGYYGGGWLFCTTTDMRMGCLICANPGSEGDRDACKSRAFGLGVSEGDSVGLLLDVGAGTLAVYVNGERMGMLVRPGMRFDNSWEDGGTHRGPVVPRLKGPLRWVVDLYEHGDRVSVRRKDPPAVTAEDLEQDLRSEQADRERAERRKCGQYSDQEDRDDY